ncbi:MAG: DNA methylase [Methylobacter sp.]|nr:MAG: DNA methylase [Methylobacter sp.]
MGYLGSKGASGVYQAIIANMPPHDVYIEAFLGSGVVMRRKPPACRSIGIDLDNTVLDPEAYPGIELICTDATHYLAAFDYGRYEKVLVFCDPPYLQSTRTSSSRYKHEFTDDDHLRLIDVIRQVPADVIISGYPSALYAEHLADWRTFQYQAMTRGGVRTEQLWFNYAPDAVYWSAYAGKDFIDRQRIKRKAKRWADNYAALPAAEQLAILSAMLARAQTDSSMEDPNTTQT